MYDRLKLANYRSIATGPCALCPANGTNDAMLWTELREDASWVFACYTAALWRALHPNHIALLDLPGASVLTYMPDIMHNKHMGTDAYLYASTLWVLCYLLLDGAPSVNLQRVWAMMLEWYQANPLMKQYKFANLKLSMFTDPDEPMKTSPKMKGTASEVRALGPALLHVWERLVPTTDATPMWKRHVHLALKHSCRIEEILGANSESLTFDDDDAAAFAKSTFRMLLGYNAARAFFAEELPPDEQLKLFNVTIKFHYMAHIGLLAKWYNPRVGWCYGGEDYMAKCKKLMASCVRGNSPADATRKFLDKYFIGMGIELCGADSWYEY